MLPEVRFVVGGWQVVVALHGIGILVGVVAGAALAVRRAHEPVAALLAVAVVAVAALAGAHALYRALHGGPGGPWSGGLASTGGVAAGLAAAWVVARLTRRSVAEVLDVIAPAGLLALAIGRLGCFLGGCCYGRPTGLPWGVVFPEPGAPPRHPLQLYSAVGDLALLGVLPGRTASSGTAARRACVGFGLLRAALECLRDPGTTDLLPGGWLTLPQLAALVLAMSAALAPRLRPQEPSTMPPARRTPAHGR